MKDSASSRFPLLPAAATPCYQRGEILANSGYYLEALNCFDRAISLQPNFAQAWIFRGVVLIHLGHDQEALVSCDRALAINPNDQEAWTFRGVALHRQGHYRQSYASYNKALEVQRLASSQTSSAAGWSGNASALEVRGADRSWRNLWTGWNFTRLFQF